MTIRRRIALAALATSLALGGLVTGPVTAAPATASAPTAVADLAPRASAAFSELAGYLWTDSRQSYVNFATLRDSLAAEVATQLGLDPATMQAAWRRADTEHQAALMAALSQLGVKYRGYKRIPGVGFDCSGLTSWAWQQAGLTIPRTSRLQIRDAEPVTLETAQAGDLVYYPGHVMMYLGVDLAVVHSPQPGKTVTVDIVTKRHVKRLKFGDPTD